MTDSKDLLHLCHSIVFNNNIGIFWQYAKTNGVAKKPLKKNGSLQERVTQDLRFISKNKALIRSFFLSSSVAYAKD